MIISIDPTTGIERERFPYQTPQEINTALSAAHTAQAAWRLRPIADRVNLLRSMAKVLRAGRSAYAELITLEMGKPILEAEGEIDKCAWNCEFYAEAAPRFLAPETRRDECFRERCRVRSPGRGARDHAVELSVLAVLSLRRSGVRGRQRDRPEARQQCSTVRAGGGGGRAQGRE